MKTKKSHNLTRPSRTMIINKLLLREFIEQAFLSEAAADTAPDTSGVFGTFIQPFVDVGSTAAYGIKANSTQLQTIVKGLLHGIPTLIVPFLSFDYGKFRELERARLDSVTKKYEGVLGANLSALQTNDAFGVAFLLAPTQVMATQLAIKLPYVAARAVQGILGNESALGAEFFKKVGDILQGPASIGFHNPGHYTNGGWATGGGGGDYGGGDYGGGDDGGMYEGIDRQPQSSNVQNGQSVPQPSAAQGQVTQQPSATILVSLSSMIQGFIKRPDVIKAIDSSGIAVGMKRDGVKLLVDHVSAFMKIETLDQVEKMGTEEGFSSVFSQIEKDIQQTAGEQDQQNDSSRERQEQEAGEGKKEDETPEETSNLNSDDKNLQDDKTAVLGQIKDTYKTGWIEQLQNLIKKYPESATELQAGIAQIGSMK